MRPEAPKQSKQHLALLSCAPDTSLGIALRGFLWEINAHWGLVSLPLVCHNLQQMLDMAGGAWGPDLREWGLESWTEVLDWIAENQTRLAENVGGHFAAGFSGQGTHPLMGDGVTRHSVYATLCNSHVDPAKQSAYRLLQAHLLVAKVAAMRHHSTREQYESYSGTPALLRKLAWPYSAALTVRRISEGLSLDLLETLPVELPPLEFLDSLHEVVPSTSDDIERYACLVNFLDKAFNHTPQQKRGPHQRTGDSAARRRLHGGQTDFWLSVQRDELPMEDRKEQSGHRKGGHSTSSRGRHKSKEADQLLDLDDCPGEDEEDEDIDRTGFDDKAFQRDPGSFHEVSASQVMQVQMANQLFPWAYGELCAAEIAPLFARCRRECAIPGKQMIAGGSTPAEELELLALAQVMFWTSSSIERAVSLKLLDRTTSGRHSALSLLLKTKDGFPRWRIRSPLPDYRRPQAPVPAGMDRNRAEFLELPDVADGSFLVRKLLESRAAVPHTSVAPNHDPQAPVPATSRVFLHKTAWYRKHLGQLFQSLAPETRLTESRLARFLFTRLLKASGGDLTATAIITGNAVGLSRVKLFYACPRTSRLETLYTQVAESVNQELWRAMGKEPPKPAQYSLCRRDIYIGNRICPTRDAVRKAISRLQSELQRSGQSSTVEGQQQYHNLFTFYTLWMFFYTTGVRGIRTPYLSLAEIDPVFHLGVLTDKDSGIGYKTRLVRFTPSLIERMKFYQEFISRSPRSYLLPGAPCFLLGSNLDPVEARPMTLTPILNEFLPFPVNIHRRFVSSELLDAGCPPEMVSAWMGHWHRGEEPWGKFSSFSFGDYCHALEEFLDPLLQDLGFRPIKGGAQERRTQ